ncbi:MAG TPA: SET domain-containing protein-lysine N-methyltransferase [Gemmatimonadaceae bacterium]|nr:SET domain-containing protein-lysine N-methyltransferase [Gemmatimonadaceae bacterium]
MAKVSQQPFELRKSDIQGRGAFATRLIRRGQRVAEYTGEHIDNDEADRRYDDEKMKRHHTFLFIVNDDEVIDAAVGGNDSRFINHSCDPNCEAVVEGKRIFIYALRTIRPGEELAYDYQYERTGDHTEEDEAFYKCRCGAPNCRGSILAPKKPARRPKPKKRPAATKRRKQPRRGEAKRRSGAGRR